jgi:DNA-binding NarL/FixJ family response regulator
MAPPIRVLLADDSEVMRRAIGTQLSHDPTVALIAEARNYAEMIDLMSDTQFDVVLMDLRMPDGAEVDITAVRTKLEGVCLLAMSVWTDPATRERAAQFGAFKLLDKANLAPVLIATI